MSDTPNYLYSIRTLLKVRSKLIKDRDKFLTEMESNTELKTLKSRLREGELLASGIGSIVNTLYEGIISYIDELITTIDSSVND